MIYISESLLHTREAAAEYTRKIQYYAPKANISSVIWVSWISLRDTLRDANLLTNEVLKEITPYLLAGND